MRIAFPAATYRDPALRSCSQAGLVNNLNDALAWGLVPLFLAAEGASVGEIGLVAGLYPAVWGIGQIGAGHWSDTRRPQAADRRRDAAPGRRADAARGIERRAWPSPRSLPLASGLAQRSSTRR